METKYNDQVHSHKGTLRGVTPAGALMAFVGCQTSPAAAAPSNIGGTNIQPQSTQGWDRTFPQSTRVEHHKVTFASCRGITLAANLHLPKKRGGDWLSTIIIGDPSGAVRGQSSGLHMQTIAEHGFVMLVFDPSYIGENGGQPCSIASPDINTEDFSAVANFVGLSPEMSHERIDIIGICNWGGTTLNVVAMDKRVKVVMTNTMYDMAWVMSKDYSDGVTLEQRIRTLKRLGQQRWKDAENGTPTYQPPCNELKGGETRFLIDYHGYYMTSRGYHPRTVNSGSA